MSGKRFETIEIKPLKGRTELPTHRFENFLCAPSTEYCNHGTYVSSSLERNLLDEFFVKFNIIFGELFRESEYFRSIASVLRPW